MTTTRELTREAAFRMLMDGSKPSIQKIREILGKGSDKTIMDGLNEFWDELGQLITDWRTYPKLPNELAVAMNEWWHLAMKQSHQELDKDRVKMQQAIALSEAKADKANFERDQASSRVDTLILDNDKLTAQLKNLEQAYQQLRTNIAGLESKNTALTTAEEKLNQQLRDNENKHQDALKLAYERGEATENNLAQQISDWKIQTKKLQTSLSTKETELATLNAKRFDDAEKHQQQLNKSAESLKLASQKNSQLTETIEKQAMKFEILGNKVKSDDQKVKNLLNEISELKNIVSGFKAKESVWEISQQQLNRKFDQLLEKMTVSASTNNEE